MLTIKNVLPNNTEDVIEAERLTFRPESKGATPDAYQPAAVFAVTIPKGDVITFSEGTLYVMNSAGKTVSVYHLHYPEPGA